MILNIRLTDSAVEAIIQRTGLEHEDAEELAQEVISLCDKHVSPTPRYPKERKLFQEIRELIGRHKDDSSFEAFVQGDALRLESSLEQFFDLGEDPEGEGTDPRLQKARELIARLANLRAEDGGRMYPSESLLDEAEEWIREEEK